MPVDEEPGLPRDLPPSAVTRSEGGADPLSALMPRVYRELRRLATSRLAHEPPGQTLQATALVHEAYLRLMQSGVQWSSRGHFFGAAARAMRCILVDRARARRAQKRGGARQRMELADALAPAAPADVSNDDLLALDIALARLEQRDERKAQIVMMRFFAGLTIEETAEALGLSPTTVKDEWIFARAWLKSEIAGNG